MMEDDLKAAFDKIHAEQSLKKETKQFIYNKVYNKVENENCHTKYGKKYYRKYRGSCHTSKKTGRVIAAVVCCMIVVLGMSGYYTYNTPAAVISFDINPSIELEVNMFDKIINVTSYNSDGQSIIDGMNLKNKNYIAAIKEILKNETIISFLQSDNNVEILVAGKDETKSDTMRTCLLEEINIDEENIHCGNWENSQMAHSQGLSCGKYQVYLQLHDLNPSITIEDIKNRSMRELRQMLQNINNVNENDSIQNDTTLSNQNNVNNFNENVERGSNCGNGQEKRHQHKHGQGD